MPLIIPEFENLHISLKLMAEIATHPYTKWQKLKPIPIPELKIATHPSGTSVSGISWE